MKSQFTRYELHEYLAAGCMQMETPVIGAGLHSMTDGRMCNGCPEYPRCDALKKLRSGDERKPPPDVTGETVKQEAARRGISISDVRRQRNAHLSSNTGNKPPR